MMRFGHAEFQNAEGTVEFIRVLNKLFDLLNVRNPFGKGFKQPLNLENGSVWNATIDSSITYLLALKDINGIPLSFTSKKGL